MAIYTALAAALWFAMRWWRGSRFVPEHLVRRESIPDFPPHVLVTSIVCQTVACFLLLYVFGRSDLKGQAIGAAAAAGALSVIGVRLIMPLPGAGPYWLAPLLAATLGYLVNYLSPAGVETAHLAGPFASLARALPVDHLVAGPSAAVVAYWYTQNMGVSQGETLKAPPAAA
jgi:hypothetical protein